MCRDDAAFFYQTLITCYLYRLVPFGCAGLTENAGKENAEPNAGVEKSGSWKFFTPAFRSGIIQSRIFSVSVVQSVLA